MAQVCRGVFRTWIYAGWGAGPSVWFNALPILEVLRTVTQTERQRALIADVTPHRSAYRQCIMPLRTLQTRRMNMAVPGIQLVTANIARLVKGLSSS